MAPHLHLTCELIERAFGTFFPSDLPPEEQELREFMLRHLIPWIHHRLRHTPEQLVQLLYRIDLPEEQFHAAMMAHRPAEAMARSVLSHMERKAQWRLRFGS
jgi:hypothetical protein